MSVHRCHICKKDPGVFFLWTSGRYFPVDMFAEKLNITDKKYIKSLKSDGYKVCYCCYNKLKD